LSGFDLAVMGGTIVTPRFGAEKAGQSPPSPRQKLYVTGGRVALIDSDSHPVAEVVDASGLLVLPGMVDTHVHLMDPGDTSREDFPSGTAAAIANGVTTIVEHTHGHPIRRVEDLAEKQTHLEGRSHVDFGLAAHVWAEDLDQLAGLWEQGVAFFKIFTCTTHGVPAVEGETLTRVLEEIARFDGNCLIHCEDENLTLEAEKRLREEGRTDPGLLIDWRNRAAEEVATAAAALLVRHAGARATIAHVSTPEVAAIVTAARGEGARVVAEACPQYLHLWEEEVRSEGGLRKFTPPARLRSPAEENEMWELVTGGAFSHFSTDHAPSTLAQKEAGNIWEVPFGLPGLDTTMPLLMTAVAGGRLSWERLVDLYSESPARRYGLYPRKGNLDEGADADFILVDPEPSWKVGDRPLLSKAGWSPYQGREVKGRVEATYLRGEEAATAGRPVEDRRGRFLPAGGA
jgi:dihydroorotase (multifunctional complex type)